MKVASRHRSGVYAQIRGRGNGGALSACASQSTTSCVGEAERASRLCILRKLAADDDAIFGAGRSPESSAASIRRARRHFAAIR